MTSERLPPPDPNRRTRGFLRPPGLRSRAALKLISAAGEKRFALPRCVACGAFAWPIPELCPRCLGEIALAEAPRGGTVLATTKAEMPADPYFRERAPWRVGLVQMDAEPSALVHLHPAVATGERVALTLMLDRAGQAVLHAGPVFPEPDMQSDPQWQEMVADPRGRRILITDARHFAAAPMAEALLAAGAAEVVLGLPEAWKPFAAEAALGAMPGVRVEPLDLTSDRSVQDLAARIGSKVEILINSAEVLRPGGLLTPGAQVEARAAMELVALGQIRLARAFAPAMTARSADGARGAVAWINLLSIFAYARPPELAGYGAAHAAALALSHSLRAELNQGGVRLMTVLTGPTEDEWFQRFPHSHVSGKALAASVLDGLLHGLEMVVVGDVARDMMARHRDDPRSLQHELAESRR